ncbi:MAG: flavodoxin family protein [Candidatus Cryosericum sp.]
MADALVVYYSLDGDVRYLAHALAKEFQLDSIELELVRPHPTRGFMKYFMGGFLAATGATPPLQPLAHDAAHYETVFVGTPVWNNRPAPAVRTFLKGADFTGKKVAFFSCYGDNDAMTQRILGALVPQADVVGRIGFKLPLKMDKDQCVTDLLQWARDLLSI